MASNQSQTSTTTTVTATSPSSLASSSSSMSNASVDSLRNHGASWFENLSTLAFEYTQQKIAKSQPQTPLPLESPTAEVTPAMHGYGNSFFQHEPETLAKQTVDAKPMNNYGDSWFDNFGLMWEDYQQVKLRKSGGI
ncbi:hypothetical protein A1O1_05213 [Capronia coronata CBS 617.96]|uniref:Uncharacterized protein n=1 Tax=Capronia coronata CBS 617.96 TaxID=1182541 RepID=W9Y6X0_9EURO|nr:uncharacterized protein A1O1_05213 [Capronia coronata CBS 617.96]EXJ88283.1 hypothetical protein A1O1_05213 [Capronia coronata CBS 617.96]